MSPWDRQTTATPQITRAAEVDQGLRSYMLKVYNYMTSGVLLTGVVAYFAGNSPAFLTLMFGDMAAPHMTMLGWIIAFAPVIMVLVLGRAMQTMSVTGLRTTFWAYAGVMGLSLFSIFLMYTGASIMRVFFITAGTFGLLSLYGYTTKKDLTSWGTFLFVGLWAVFFASIANIFMHSSGFYFAISIIGVLLAVGLTAYNTQQVKEIYYASGRGGEMTERAAIMGALQLYFDFIYLFINLLRLFGDRR